MYEVELVRAQIEHKEPMVVAFLNLRYAKLRKLQLYCNFLTKVCDNNKFEEWDMDTDSLYVALVEKKLEDCIKPEMKADW